MLIAEMALEQKRQGRSVPEYLDRISRQFGYFRNEVLNIVMTGIEGKSNMVRMLDTLRKTPPKEIGGLLVTGFEDLRDENGRMGPIKGETDFAGRNVLIFRLGKDQTSKVVLSPSGTEPKAKAYLEVSSPPAATGTSADAWDKACRMIDEKVQKVASDFLSGGLATVGQTPAPEGNKLSR